MVELAIIGGGPSAVCVMEAVAQHVAALGAVSITVFEPGPNLWRGRVFQPDGDEVLANVPMVEMSARSWDSGHGVRWMRERGLDALATDTVVPQRSLVGRYLRDTANRTRTALRQAGSRVRVEEHAVDALLLHGGRWWVHIEGHRSGPFDHAVLCPGASASYDPYQLAGTDGFLGDPFPMHDTLPGLSPHSRVGIVGSGLTAVDVVMALRARGHRGPITLLSRNGMLPAVRHPPVQHQPRHLTVPRLEALADRNAGLDVQSVIDLATAELTDAGADTAAIAGDIVNRAPPVRRLRDDLDRAQDRPDPGWTILRGAMVTCGQDAWYLLRDDAKEWVRARHQTIMRLCCPMPTDNAARLLDMFDIGQLDMLPGVAFIQPCRPGKFAIQASRPVVVDTVVSAATPAMHHPARAARLLLNSLTSQGHALPHPFGGVHIERTTSRIINQRGAPNPNLHALGDLTNGAYLFTFGMPVLTARADDIARDIAITVHSNHEERTRGNHLPFAN